jgi:hypothetical protein
MNMATLEPQRTVRRGSAAEVARHAIELAEQDGVDRKKMILRLTLRDASELKRDPKLATADISFGGGGMRYLGVLVEQGGVTVSRLDRGGDADATSAAPIDPPAKVKAPRKKKAVTAV